MFTQFDRVILATLTAELLTIRENPVLVDDIFALEPEPERARIRSAFANVDIAAKLGYPRAPTEMPGVFVVLGNMEETEQTIGSSFGTDVIKAMMGPVEGDPLFWEDHEGAFMQSSLRLCCWTENADLTSWLQTVVAWGLFRRREELTGIGFIEQKLSATDFEPIPQWFPSFAYRRDVRISAKHVVTFTKKYLPIRAVQVEAESDGETTIARRER